MQPYCDAPTPNIILANGWDQDLSHLVSNCESQRLTFQVSKSELNCKSFYKSKLKILYLFNDCIDLVFKIEVLKCIKINVLHVNFLLSPKLLKKTMYGNFSTCYQSLEATCFSTFTSYSCINTRECVLLLIVKFTRDKGCISLLFSQLWDYCPNPFSFI